LDQTLGNPGTVELKEGKRPIPPPSEITVKAGSLLFKEGDASREVYIIKDGTLSVSQRHGSQQVELARLCDRAVLGEMSLLDNQPRSATVRAVTDCKLTVIAPVTFQGMLRLIPAWLLAVIKVVTHRLRETNRKINQHTVLDPIESLCQFLTLKCLTFAQINKGVPNFPWFILVDEFSMLTRMKRDDIQKTAQILVSRGLVSVNAHHDIVIPDPQLLDILREAQHCTRIKEPFQAATLEPLILTCLENLPKVTPENLLNLGALCEDLRNRLDSRISISHVTKMRDMGVLHVLETGPIIIDKSNLEWILKAHREIDRVLGIKEGTH